MTHPKVPTTRAEFIAAVRKIAETVNPRRWNAVDEPSATHGCIIQRAGGFSYRYVTNAEVAQLMAASDSHDKAAVLAILDEMEKMA